MDHMTALVSAFARAYHYRNNAAHVFADPFAEKLLTEEEYAAVSGSMSQGISYFAPGFSGTPEEALRHIVDRQLAPSVLARSAFCERAAADAVRAGCSQIVLFACGYDTFSLRARETELRVYELDLPEMIEDRRRRIARAGLEPAYRTESVACDLSLPSWKDALLSAGFDPKKPAFGSMLGISYYLSEAEFRSLVRTVSSVFRGGSCLCFDYPAPSGGEESRRTREMAAAAGEAMQAAYSRAALENLLSEAGFRIRTHLDAAGADEAFFAEYSRLNPKHPMAAPEGVGYCLAVRGTSRQVNSLPAPGIRSYV